VEPPIHRPDGAESAPDPAPTSAAVWSADPISQPTAVPEIRYGGFWRRSAAFILDAFVIAIAGVPATVLTLTAYGSALSTVVTIVTALVGLGYLPFCWARWGMTVGNALMGLRVVRAEDMERISWWRALGRLFSYYFAFVFFGLGILWVGWEPRKRGWHDRLADTLVLRVPSLRERRSRGRKWAIAAALVGAGSLVLNLVVGITIGISVAQHGFRDADGDLVGSQVLSISALEAGDCFDPFLNGLTMVSASQCRELHTYEVFGTAELPNGSFPSQDEMQQVANDKCVPAFNRYVGLPLDSSTWQVGYLGPEPGSWVFGERTLTCFLGNESGTRIRGSAKGSAE
jgi:uncharacterized RDD family membrane protein YckC